MDIAAGVLHYSPGLFFKINTNFTDFPETAEGTQVLPRKTSISG
jgi:hypothetical protein